MNEIPDLNFFDDAPNQIRQIKNDVIMVLASSKRHSGIESNVRSRPKFRAANRYLLLTRLFQIQTQHQ